MWLSCVRFDVMDENLDSFLDTNKNFKYNENKTRVICLLTNHELACNVSALKSYMTGKKYQQLTRHGDIDFGKIEQYKQYLIPSRKGKQKLYCKITKKEINNIPYQIERHVIGRKFQRDLKLYLQTANGAENKKDEQHNDNDEEMKDATEEGNKSGDDLSEDLDENDKSMCEDDDAEFFGGIWDPEFNADISCNGNKDGEGNHEDADSDDDDDNDDMELSTNAKPIPTKKPGISEAKAKQKRKRKFKDNKKGKLSSQVGRKRKH